MVLLFFLFINQNIDLLNHSKLYMELNESETVELKGFPNMATFFESVKNLEIVVKPDGSEEYGPFSSDNKVRGCHYKDRNYTIEVTSQKNETSLNVFSVIIRSNCTKVCLGSLYARYQCECQYDPFDGKNQNFSFSTTGLFYEYKKSSFVNLMPIYIAVIITLIGFFAYISVVCCSNSEK